MDVIANAMTNAIDAINTVVWGYILIYGLLAVGIYFSIRLRFLQIFHFREFIRAVTRTPEKDSQGITPIQALTTSLASRVGTGNIAGVAVAVYTGGPGALFWMWVAAFFGMATKYAEGLLAIKYRRKDAHGAMAGGPMHYILLGMGEKWRPLAIFFAIAGILVALLGIGTFTQVNSITEAMQNTIQLPPAVTASILAILVALVIFSGIQSIARVSTKVVPFMAAIYILGTVTVLAVNLDRLLPTLQLVFSSAFSQTAAIGGFAGATIQMAIQNGVARGVFSNESGLGSAPIAAAAARTKEPVEQGLISMTGTFIDTLIICSLTGLTILITGVWDGNLNGVSLTQAAFASVFANFGPVLLSVFLVLFAFTTILGWNYYGERCFEFLFGVRYIRVYRLLFVLMIVLGGFVGLEAVWILADIVNALMALPNLIALLALSPIVIGETKKYFDKHRKN